LQQEIEEAEQEIVESASKLDIIAKVISEKRQKAIPVLTEKLVAILELLGMPNVRFKIEVDLSGNYHANGKDDLQFLFAANKGSDFGLLKKTASGGEMSRIMLDCKINPGTIPKLPSIILMKLIPEFQER